MKKAGFIFLAVFTTTLTFLLSTACAQEQTVSGPAAGNKLIYQNKIKNDVFRDVASYNNIKPAAGSYMPQPAPAAVPSMIAYAVPAVSSDYGQLDNYDQNIINRNVFIPAKQSGVETKKALNDPMDFWIAY